MHPLVLRLVVIPMAGILLWGLGLSFFSRSGPLPLSVFITLTAVVFLCTVFAMVHGVPFVTT